MESLIVSRRLVELTATVAAMEEPVIKESNAWFHVHVLHLLITFFFGIKEINDVREKKCQHPRSHSWEHDEWVILHLWETNKKMVSAVLTIPPALEYAWSFPFQLGLVNEDMKLDRHISDLDFSKGQSGINNWANYWMITQTAETRGYKMLAFVAFIPGLTVWDQFFQRYFSF